MRRAAMSLSRAPVKLSAQTQMSSRKWLELLVSRKTTHPSPQKMKAFPSVLPGGFLEHSTSAPQGTLGSPGTWALARDAPSPTQCDSQSKVARCRTDQDEGKWSAFRAPWVSARYCGGARLLISPPGRRVLRSHAGRRFVSRALERPRPPNPAGPPAPRPGRGGRPASRVRSAQRWERTPWGPPLPDTARTRSCALAARCMPALCRLPSRRCPSAGGRGLRTCDLALLRSTRPGGLAFSGGLGAANRLGQRANPRGYGAHVVRRLTEQLP